MTSARDAGRVMALAGETVPDPNPPTNGGVPSKDVTEAKR